MSEFSTLVRQIRGTRSMAEFADELGLSHAAISRYESGKRQQEPEDSAIAKLLRVATPDQAQELLRVLDVDVEQLRAAILASLGVKDVTVAMVFEKSHLDEKWVPINRALAETELGSHYTNPAHVIAQLEASAKAAAPEPGGCIFTPQAVYRATVTATVGGNGSEKKGKE